MNHVFKHPSFYKKQKQEINEFDKELIDNDASNCYATTKSPSKFYIK